MAPSTLLEIECSALIPALTLYYYQLRQVDEMHARLEQVIFSGLYVWFCKFCTNASGKTSQEQRFLPDNKVNLCPGQAGRRVGSKVLELYCWREKAGKGDGKRYNRLIELLTFISQNVWKQLFGKAADSLEKGSSSENEYMIIDESPVTNTFVSVPSDLGNMNCAAYMAGVVSGILDAASFPGTVSAVFKRAEEPGGREGTVILINFSDEVIEREERLA